jgi:hypothetical protein
MLPPRFSRRPSRSGPRKLGRRQELLLGAGRAEGATGSAGTCEARFETGAGNPIVWGLGARFREPRGFE